MNPVILSLNPIDERKRCLAQAFLFAGRALPYHPNPPTIGTKRANLACVTCLVGGYLRTPEGTIGLWPFEVQAIVAMPEAAIDEYRSIESR